MQPGFTLIEALVAMVVLVLLAVASLEAQRASTRSLQTATAAQIMERSLDSVFCAGCLPPLATEQPALQITNGVTVTLLDQPVSSPFEGQCWRVRSTICPGLIRDLWRNYQQNEPAGSRF